jgi:hypothetical protein
LTPGVWSQDRPDGPSRLTPALTPVDRPGRPARRTPADAPPARPVSGRQQSAAVAYSARCRGRPQPLGARRRWDRDWTVLDGPAWYGQPRAWTEPARASAGAGVGSVGSTHVELRGRPATGTRPQPSAVGRTAASTLASNSGRRRASRRTRCRTPRTADDASHDASHGAGGPALADGSAPSRTSARDGCRRPAGRRRFAGVFGLAPSLDARRERTPAARTLRRDGP